ncbi:MAG: molybdopterin molybdenumtransferase MoeA, partial [Clostridiales bacterium]|nr:molybdopterin molybdenumtransferase MoeA [Clostridiales bacterium]
MEFLNADSIETAREKLLSFAGGLFAATELLPPHESLGRILAGDIAAGEDIPGFKRSSVDGYAVLSADTAAAGEGAPVFLTVRGQVEIGNPVSFSIGCGECAAVPTGGMLPVGADAVVMIEYAELFGDGEVALYAGVSHGENVVQADEDAKAGDVILHRGKQILPQDIGAMAAAGITEVPVCVRPRLTIISTG